MSEHRRRRAKATAPADQQTRRPAPVGGRFAPLEPADLHRIVGTAMDILARIGMANLPPALTERVCARGAHQRDDGRICFPHTVVEDAIRRAPRTVDLPGYRPARSLQIGGSGVHLGTGGAAVQVLDADRGVHRDSTLADLYDLMRLLDDAPNIAYGVRPVVARDMRSPLELDLNTAFACLKATSKPIGVSFSEPRNVAHVAELFDISLGGLDRFRRHPYAMAVIVHAVPPLAFAPDGVEILEAAIEAGMVPQICSAGQVGATSPVTLAGALAQGLAEILAGLVMVDLFQPGGPCIYALMPFVSDLRTGAMSGGGGETAMASAAAAQVLAHLGLPATVSAGMTDAKVMDAQAGYEKGHTVALAAQAGADMVNLSMGMLGSIMVASPETLMLDDDYCGAILRACEMIEVTDRTLDIREMERVVTGPGHYLGEASTLARMKTDFVYPTLADRRSVSDWAADGAPTAWDRARARVAQTRAAPPPDHLPKEIEHDIRKRFPIHLPPEV